MSFQTLETEPKTKKIYQFTGHISPPFSPGATSQATESFRCHFLTQSHHRLAHAAQASPQMHFRHSNSEDRSNPCSPSTPKLHPQPITAAVPQKQALLCYQFLLLSFSGPTAHKCLSLYHSQSYNRSHSLCHGTTPAPHLLRCPSLLCAPSSSSSQIAQVSCVTEDNGEKKSSPPSHSQNLALRSCKCERITQCLMH